MKKSRFKLRSYFYAAAILLALLIQTVFIGKAIASPASHRIAGYTQYDTSASIAEEGWVQSDYAVLAYGENFPDALAAAPLAKKYDAPILLTQKQVLTPIIKQTLQSLGVKNVFIAGGTAVVSQNVENELKAMGISVSRFAGNDQYDTAIEIARQLGPVQEISVVTGSDFSDALSIASISAVKNAPVILVPSDHIPDSVSSYLASNNTILRSYIVGNSDQISETVSSRFPYPERISGNEKYTRNIAVLKNFDSSYNFATIFIATGNGFADALSGTAYAAKLSAPIVLVEKNTLSSETQGYLKAKVSTSKDLTVLGGEAVISNSLLDSILVSPSSPSTQVNSPASSDAVKISSVNLNDEIVTISNGGSADIDLTGWYLVSEQGSQTFSFPSRTIIKAGEHLKIVSGPKAVAGTNTLLWTKVYIWNNDGDPGTLYDSQGQVISRYP